MGRAKIYESIRCLVFFYSFHFSSEGTCVFPFVLEVYSSLDWFHCRRTNFVSGGSLHLVEYCPGWSWTKRFDTLGDYQNVITAPLRSASDPNFFGLLCWIFCSEPRFLVRALVSNVVTFVCVLPVHVALEVCRCLWNDRDLRSNSRFFLRCQNILGLFQANSLAFLFHAMFYV